MKKLLGLLKLGAVLLVVTGCPLDRSTTVTDLGGSVTLRFETATARTILPTASPTVTAYSVIGSGPDEAVFAQTITNSWLRLELAAGAWTVSVQGLNTNGLVLLEGSASFEVVAAASQTVVMELAPAAGSGSFSLSFKLPANTDPEAEIQLDLTTIDNQTSWPRLVKAPWAETVWEDLTAGYYQLSIRLNDGAESRGEAEIICILPNTRTSYLADFAAAPGYLSFSIVLPDQSPLNPQLPAWRYWSAARNLPLNYQLDTAASVSWFLDGQILGGTMPDLGLAEGQWQLAISAIQADYHRAGSAACFIDVLAGMTVGDWQWQGVFQAAADPALPSTGRFCDLAAALVDGVYRLTALDTGASGSIVSHLHHFKAADDGNLFYDQAVPARPSGTASTRMVNRLLVSTDGSTSLSWKNEGSWAVWRRADVVVQIDKATIDFPSDLKIQAAAIADSGSTVYLLLSSTSRLVAITITESSAATLWSLDLTGFTQNVWSALALGTDGWLCAATAKGNCLVLVDPAGKDGNKVSSLAWLSNPSDVAALPTGGFLVLCPAAGAVGRLLYTLDENGNFSFQADCPSGFPLTALANTNRLAVNPLDGSFAALGAPDPNLPGSVVLFTAEGAATVFDDSLTTAGLACPRAGVWTGPGCFYCADGSARFITLLRQN